MNLFLILENNDLKTKYEQIKAVQTNYENKINEQLNATDKKIEHLIIGIIFILI